MSAFRVDTRPRRRNSGKAAETRSFPGHLAWLRTRPCAVGDRGPCGFMPTREKMEAHHVSHAGGKGTGLKVADYKAVPLCPQHHAEFHDGPKTFERKYRIDLVAAAAAYAKASPHRRKWEDM